MLEITLIKKQFLIRIMNVVLRAASMGSRFALILVLAKLISPVEVGLYGVMLVSVSYGVMVLGGDYYTYSQRELLSRKPEEWFFVIRHQIIATIFLYIIFLPAHLLLFKYDLMNWKYVNWFFILLVFEHISQEVNRLLIAMQRQLMASFILFVRLGSWVLIMLPLLYYFPYYRNLNTIYLAWSLGCLLAIILGVISIKNHLLVKKYNAYIDYAWIRKGYIVGGWFFLGSLCIRGLFTFDKYAVENFGSLEVLGVYVFYMTLVMGAFNFLNPAVFSFVYPKMLKNYGLSDKTAYDSSFKELIYSTLFLSSLIAGLVWISTPYLILWIDKTLYLNYLENLSLLITVGFLFTMGYIPHYALYAMKGDFWIVLSHVTSLLLFLGFLFFLDFEDVIKTMSLVLIVVFSWMLLIKCFGYILVRKKRVLFN